MNQARSHLRSLPRQIASRLAELRKRLTIWVLVRGFSRWLLLALAVVAADILLDRFFKMDFAQRLIMLVVMLLLVASVFCWRVIRPLFNRISDNALLHEIESRYPELNENLISGAQLARQQDLESRGVSMELAEATIKSSISLAEKMDFGATINRTKLVKNGALLAFGAFATLFLAAGVLQTDFFRTWFNRNILLTNDQWPRSTYLQIVGAENGVLVLPRGTDHRLIVRVSQDSTVKNVDVTVEIDNTKGKSIHQMKPTGKLDGREHLFVMHNVSSELTLRARGGDDLTSAVTVRLLEPPSILNLEMWAELPVYAKMPNQKLEGPGPHSVLTGSRIRATATVNKSLKQFSIESESANVSLIESERALTYNLTMPGNDSLLAGGQYQFKLVDESGLASIRPAKFVIRIKKDAPPKVLASLLGIHGLAVPRARVPVSYNAMDEYGLTAILFHTNWKNPELVDSGDSTGSKDISITKFSAQKDIVRKEQDVAVLDIEPFRFEPGTSFRLLVRATDTRPGPANSADSEEFLIRIVSEEELRADLLRREIEQRKAFQRSYDAQLELSAELQVIAAMQQAELTKEKFDADRQSKMISLSRDQKLIGTNLDTIANRFEEFLVEAQNNRLDEDQAEIAGTQTIADRFDNQIIRPIRLLDRELISMATRALDNCRRLLNNENELLSAVEKTTEIHQEILNEMRRIQSAMEDSESFQEVVNRLLAIKRGQDRIKAEIKRRKPENDEILDEDDIFDDD